MQAKKSLGQNFLMHAHTAARIADAAQLSKADTVLEIGPGTGRLTRELLARAGHVVAIEADGALVEELKERFVEEIASERLTLIHADIREWLSSPHMMLPTPYRLVANIPYYITGELLRSFLESTSQPSSITFLVQKEVAERIAPRLSSGRARKKESLLSLSVKAYGTPKYEFTVPRGAFVPAPSVDSAVLSIRDISRRRFASPREEARFFELIRAGFAHKRKLLSGNLAGLVSPASLREAGIPEKVRAEDLSLDDWLHLATAPVLTPSKTIH